MYNDAPPRFNRETRAINPYQSPPWNPAEPSLLQSLLDSQVVTECDFGMGFGGLSGALAGECYGLVSGRLHNGWDVLIHGNTGYVTGTILGGLVGLAALLTSKLLTRRKSLREAASAKA